MYYSLEMPVSLVQVMPETDGVAEMLEALVSSWDSEVERARATEASVTEPGAELEALKQSHRALVETLERSIADLEALQEKTAGIVRFVAEAVRSTDGEHCLTATGPTEFPATDETEVIDTTNRRDLANLDVPSRWRPLNRRRARSATD